MSNPAMRAATEALKAEGPLVQTYGQLARVVLRAVATSDDVLAAADAVLRVIGGDDE